MMIPVRRRHDPSRGRTQLASRRTMSASIDFGSTEFDGVLGNLGLAILNRRIAADLNALASTNAPHRRWAQPTEGQILLRLSLACRGSMADRDAVAVLEERVEEFRNRPTQQISAC